MFLRFFFFNLIFFSSHGIIIRHNLRENVNIYRQCFGLVYKFLFGVIVQTKVGKG
jgi:hypothetical protein